MINFDDSGFAWFMYDFATVSFIEDHPPYPSCAQRALRGLPLRGAAECGRRGRARHLRDAAPAAAGGLDRLAPHLRDRGRGAQRRLHGRHLRAGGALPVGRCTQTRRPDPVPTPLTNHIMLVTGGTKGIGKGVADIFARAGANIIIIGRDSCRARRRRRRPSAAPTWQRMSGARRTASGWRPRPSRALRRHRRAVRERRHLPRHPARGHDRGGHRRDLRHRRQGHDALGQGLPARPRARRARARRGHLVDHRARSRAFPGGRTTARRRRPSWASCARPRSS